MVSQLKQAVRHHQAGRLAEAEHIYRRVLEDEPENFHALHFLGVIAGQRGRQADAVVLLGQALGHNPKAADAHFNLGNVLKQQGKFEEAISAFNRALALDPQSRDAHTNLGVALMALGQYGDAVAAHHRALAIDPIYVAAHNNLGITLHRLGDVTDAMASYRRVLELDPGHVDAHWSHALALLLTGQFKEGWAEYEWRWRKPEFKTLKRDFKRPAPDGMSLDGKTVLLYGEQGLGDEIFFLRFAPALKRRGAHVSYVANPKIAGILSRVAFLDDVVTETPVTRSPDFILSVGDLPMVNAMSTIGDIPPPCALAPMEQRIATIRQQLQVLGPPPYIGITWRAGTANDPPYWYKLAPVADLAPVLKAAGGTFLALQRRPEAGEIQELSQRMGAPVHDFSRFNDDLEDMLALLFLIDEYVTVSNTNVHLRAGVGKASRLLIPMPPEYRWMAEGAASPWFPGCKLYRQNLDRSWNQALARLGADLAD